MIYDRQHENRTWLRLEAEEAVRLEAQLLEDQMRMMEWEGEDNPYPDDFYDYDLDYLPTQKEQEVDECWEIHSEFISPASSGFHYDFYYL